MLLNKEADTALSYLPIKKWVLWTIYVTGAGRLYAPSSNKVHIFCIRGDTESAANDQLQSCHIIQVTWAGWHWQLARDFYTIPPTPLSLHTDILVHRVEPKQTHQSYQIPRIINTRLCTLEQHLWTKCSAKDSKMRKYLSHHLWKWGDIFKTLGTSSQCSGSMIKNIKIHKSFSPFMYWYL